MTHKNLVLTETAIKAHCKRLQKELKKYNQDLSLGETQSLFSKSLGFNNWNHLSNVLVNSSADSPMEFDIKDLKSRTSLVKSLIIQENSTSLKQYLNYVFTKISEPFASLRNYSFNLGSELILILELSKMQSTLFQESIVTIIGEILVLIKKIELEQNLTILGEKDFSKNLMNKLCSLKIKSKLFEDIIKLHQFEKNDFNIGLILACENDNVEIVEHLLIKHNLNIDNFFYIGNEPVVFNPLGSAIRSNSHQTIDFLLNSTKLKKTASIHIEDNNSFKMACDAGNLPLIKKLLTSNDTENKGLIYSENCVSIILACNRDHWNVVDFLLNQINYNLEPNFYNKINRNLKFFTDISKQNKLQTMILNNKK